MSNSPLPPAKPPTPATKVRVASDADHQQIKDEMDEAFMWNVTRNREIQMTLKRLRETKPNASSVECQRIIEAITAKYRMLRSSGRVM